MDVRIATTLLDEFAMFPERFERPQTFMEIGGYPHYENVCSNFLAFFLDPEGPHKLGTLFLDGLLEAVGVSDMGDGFGGGVKVGREVGTANGNRIDLLIKSDTRVALIENKILAAVVNPFDDYAAYLDLLKDEDGADYEDKIKVLLTLYPSSEGAEQGFVNVTYTELVSAIRSRLGHKVSEADVRYITLMLDFLNTLENLGERTRMNQEFIALLGGRGNEVNKFLTGISEVRAEIRGKARELGELVKVESPQNIQQGDWRPTIPLYHALYQHVYKNGELYVAVDTVISPSGWEIQIQARSAEARQEFDGLMDKLEIPSAGSGHCTHPKRFEYGEDPANIAPVVKDLVEKIAAHHG